MQINNINSTNFNGYKNVLANRVSRPTGEKISFMSMHLDNIGSNDLDIWKFIQKNLLKREYCSNVITFHLYEWDNYSVTGFSDTLLDLDHVEKSSEEESLMMKAFTLLASLTNRIKKDKSIIFNTEYNSLSYETRADMQDVLLGRAQKSNELDSAVFGAYYSQIPPQEIASDLDSKITDKLIKYFT